MIKSELPSNPVTTRVRATTNDVYITQSPVRRHHHRHNVKSRYEFLKSLGKGTYGKVKLARHRETNKLVAVKTIKKERIRDVDMKHIKREMEIMSSIENQHIIQIYEVFENHDRIVIVMEYAAGGELYDYLAFKRGICDQEARLFFRQIVSAVRYCHKRGVVHRDLKLENILLNRDQQIKIADFGLANKFKDDSLLQTFCGSPLYASPEIVTGEPYIGPEVDSWSLGVLLYALVYGTMPFDGRDYSILTKQITTGEFCQPPHFSEAHPLICWMLTVDPLKRATIDDIAGHPWVNIINDPVSLSPTSVDDEAGYNTYLGVEIDLNENILEANKTNLAKSDAINIQVDDNHLNHHHPKSILKHKDTPLVATPTPQKPPTTPQLPKQPSADTILAGQLAAVCGLHAKDSLKLKVKPQGVSSKRRVLRSKRDRESGYYSSPERAPIPEIPPTILLDAQRPPNSHTVPRIKGAMIANQQRNMRPVVAQNAALPPRVPHTTKKECYLMPIAAQDRLTSVSSDDGSSVGSHTRPLSTYSDSSILSTDSFDLCSFENPLGTPDPNGCYPPQSNPAFNCMQQTQRPASLPIGRDTLPSPNHNALDDQEPGTLTPNSEKLVRDLQRILAPSGRRSSPRTQKHELTRRPRSLDEEGTSQLSSMMTQLNIDLDLAYKKALDICANLKVAEV